MNKHKMFQGIFIFIALACSVTNGATPRKPHPEGVFVATKTISGKTGNSNVGNERTRGCQVEMSQSLKEEINSLRIHSDIRYRYSTTQIASVLANRNGTHSREFTFSVVLPKTAFISSFHMEIDCVTYKSYVKAKGEAQKIYSQAQSKGHSAGLVESSSRNANLFTVNITARAQSKLKFFLKYEQLLQRNKIQLYEQTINISPDQLTNVQNFKITASIQESKNITIVKVSDFRKDGETDKELKANNKAIISRPAGNRATIEWSPSTNDQTAFSKQNTNGILDIRYDIEKGDDAGEILVTEDYFVHFFAPCNLKPKRKHVVFILDTSGSMGGRKMKQLQEAQNKILGDLSAEDFFNIITFSSSAFMWSPQGSSVQKNFRTFLASTANIGTARTFINALKANGGTNIYSALVDGLNLIQRIKNARNSRISPTTNRLPENVESLIIFLTDGKPTNGLQDLEEILKSIQKHNAQVSVPILSLAFGNGADFKFLEKLSLQNNAFATKIFEASDVPQQLEGFYKKISSPVLSNVTFQYTSSNYSVRDLTQTKFPNFFGGKEIAVAGRLIPKHSNASPRFQSNALNSVPQQTNLNEMIQILESRDDGTVNANELSSTNKYNLDASIKGIGRDGATNLTNPQVLCQNGNLPSQRKYLEKLWAYLLVQQLLEEDLAGTKKDDSVSNHLKGNETARQKAIRLSIIHSFVTPLTSLVVVESANKSDVSAFAEKTFPSQRPFAKPSMNSARPQVGITKPANEKDAGQPNNEGSRDLSETDSTHTLGDTNEPDYSTVGSTNGNEQTHGYYDVDSENTPARNDNDLNHIVDDTNGPSYYGENSHDQNGHDLSDTNDLVYHDLGLENIDTEVDHDLNMIDDTDGIGYYGENAHDQSGHYLNNIFDTNDHGYIDGGSEVQTEDSSNYIMAEITNEQNYYGAELLEASQNGNDYNEIGSENSHDQTGDYSQNFIDDTNENEYHGVELENIQDQNDHYSNHLIDDTNEQGNYAGELENNDDHNDPDSTHMVDETNQLDSHVSESENTHDQNSLHLNQDVDDTNDHGYHDLGSENTQDQTGDDSNHLIHDTSDQAGYYGQSKPRNLRRFLRNLWRFPCHMSATWGTSGGSPGTFSTQKKFLRNLLEFLGTSGGS